MNMDNGRVVKDGKCIRMGCERVGTVKTMVPVNDGPAICHLFCEEHADDACNKIRGVVVVND